MLRVLHISERYPGLHAVWGGAEAGCRGFLEAAEERAECWLATLPPDVAAPVPMPRLKTVRRAADGSAWDRFRTRHSIRDGLASTDAARAIRAIRPDIVHIHRFAALGWGVVDKAVRSGVPTVLSLYDWSLVCPRETLVRHDGTPCTSFANGYCATCSMPGQPRNALRRLLWSFRARSMRRLSAGAARVTVLSRSWLGPLVRFGVAESRASVLPLPLRDWPSDEAACGTGEEGRLLFVGWMQPRKGFHILLEALPGLRARHPELVVDVVVTGGDPAYEATVRQRIQELELGGSVRLLGRQSPEQLRALMAQARVVAVPEQWPNPQPVVLCEAMAMARRVVGADTGGIPDLLGRAGERGLLAIPDEPAAWTTALDRALADAASRFAAREFARRELWMDGVRDRLLSLYESL